MVSSRKKKNYQKRWFIRLKETSNVFVMGNSYYISAIGNQTLKPQTNGCSSNFGRVIDGENTACQNQAIENKIDNKNRKSVVDIDLTV